MNAVVGRYRFALAPKWWVGHVLVVAAAITMVFLGRWQLHVSEHKGFSLQNFGYAIQWWIFSAAAVLMWGKIIHDGWTTRTTPAAGTTAAPRASEIAPIEYRRYKPPAASEVADSETAAYNAYLASLADKDSS